MPQGKASVNAFDVVNAVAAGRLAPHCLVTRSASGTVVVNTATTDEQYLGVASDRSFANDDDPGFYSQYDPVAVITRGRVRLFAIGGGTDITAGNYLQAQADGLVAVESSGNKTTESVGKCVDATDIEVSDYGTNATAPTVGSRTVTVTATTNFARGDYVQIKGDTASQLALIESVDSATQVTVEHAIDTAVGANAQMNKCVEVLAVLL